MLNEIGKIFDIVKQLKYKGCSLLRQMKLQKRKIEIKPQKINRREDHAEETK